MIFTFTLLAAAPAFGWDYSTPTCPTGRLIVGGSHLWYMVDPNNDWDSDTEDAIVDAAEQWDCGGTERNRGCVWNYARSGTDRSAVSHSNAFSEVGLASYSHLVNVDNAPLNVLALTSATYQTGGGLPPGYCNIVNFDIEVLDTTTDSATWLWGLWVPSLWTESLVISLPAAMVHEFGHGIGFDHVTDPLSVMERRYAAEIGGQFRISENDYVGLQTLKPGTTTGKNFTISKWFSANISSRDQWERWGGFGETWEVSAGGNLLIDTSEDEDFGPASVAVMVNGTSSYSNVPVYWSMSSDDVCFDGDDIIIGTRNPSLSSNDPYVVGPSSGLYSIPPGTPLGEYKVCAGVDPYGTLSETDTTDNVISSERKIEVIP